MAQALKASTPMEALDNGGIAKYPGPGIRGIGFCTADHKAAKLAIEKTGQIRVRASNLLRKFDLWN